jgi:hypothetical protein
MIETRGAVTMAPKKQVAANRRNAKKSTGPKSAPGKQVVRMNALKHGLQAEHVVIPARTLKNSKQCSEASRRPGSRLGLVRTFCLRKSSTAGGSCDGFV